MATDSIATAYAGARVTRLVDRERILTQIGAAIDDWGHTHVFYIQAPGGTGKTFLAREVLERCRGGEWRSPKLLVAREEIDLYHHQNRSREGFMAALVDALQAGPTHFAGYLAQRAHLQKVTYDLRGAVSVLQAQRDLLSTQFLAECTSLGEAKRTVIVLDTVEKLMYETDRVQRALGLAGESVAFRPWLLSNWMHAMRNAVILVCGRPRPQFKAELQKTLGADSGIHLDLISLADFDESSTLDYFCAVKETAERDENRSALMRLEGISAESRHVIHHLTGGHPITLALLIDYYLVTGRLLPELAMSLSQVQTLNSQELDEVRAKVKADVVRQFQEIDRPADMTIGALAWTPKGMDGELLADLTGVEPQVGREILQALAGTHGLSFIKMRPSDERAFLQDEMYELLKEHVRDALPGLGEQFYPVILGYYADKIKGKREEMAHLREQQRLQTPAAAHGDPTAIESRIPDTSALAVAEAELHSLQVEEVYYRLRADAQDGFEAYREAIDEALQSNDETLDMQLRDEMLAFMRETFPEGTDEEVSGLRRPDLELDAAIRWVERNVYAGQPERAAEIAAYLREREAEMLAAGNPLALAELDAWEGWVAASRGSNLQLAQARLERDILKLPQLPVESEFGKRWRDGILAKAHNIMGYLLRVQGRFQAACDAYRCSLPYWRILKQEANHSETLNNLAWAAAETGDFDTALDYCEDGLHLREGLGHSYLIALSLNTLGSIEIKNDHPGEGQVHCGRALRIFRELGARRGVGLACIGLAEAHRRYADTRAAYFLERKVELLRQAADLARQAQAIFEKDAPELLRLVEAQIELGCTNRNWARLWPDYHRPDDPDRATLIQDGIEVLQKAAELAQVPFPYRCVDAFVNLAWLYYYVGESNESLKALARAEELVSAYCITERGEPEVQDPIPFIWVQLGKGHLLRALMALDTYREAINEQHTPVYEMLPLAAEHFTLSLAYSGLFSEADFRDLRRAKETIYNALKGMSFDELRRVYNGVQQAACRYHLPWAARENRQPAQPRMRSFMEKRFAAEMELDTGTPCA